MSARKTIPMALLLLAVVALQLGSCSDEASGVIYSSMDHVVIAGGLEHPWALAFLPDGRFLVTERPGRLRIIERDHTLSPPLAGVPDVQAVGQGGLLDVALDPAFAVNSLIYLSYSEPLPGGGYRLRNGPYMRRFLDGYYPMEVSIRIRYPAQLMALQTFEPAPQPGFILHTAPGEIELDARFEGRLQTRFDFCLRSAPDCPPAANRDPR